MTETTIKSVSKILQDEHGYSYIDVVLEDGTQGYYPNSDEALGLFTVGSKVKYKDVKMFAGRMKINGLTKIIQMTTTKISSITPIEIGKNNTFYREITTENGITAIHYDEVYKNISSLKEGDMIQYAETRNVKDRGDFFVGLVKMSLYSPDERRQLSIVRQSSIKAAIEIANICSAGERWTNNDGTIDKQLAVADIIEISELLIPYCLVD
jgi:hypothetical protein